MRAVRATGGRHDGGAGAAGPVRLPAEAWPGTAVILGRPSRPRQPRGGADARRAGGAARVWRRSGLVADSAGSALAGVLLRMLQTSGTTLAELLDKLPVRRPLRPFWQPF